MAKRYCFPEGNTIVYGQDMGFWEGVPSDVVFTEREEYLGKRACLTAPGYGGKPGTKDYGSGAIYVDRANLPKLLEEGWPDPRDKQITRWRQALQEIAAYGREGRRALRDIMAKIAQDALKEW